MSTFTKLTATGTAKWKALCELADAVSLYRLAIDQGVDTGAHLDNHLENLERQYRAAAAAHDREANGV
jgi:hypothetical protein